MFNRKIKPQKIVQTFQVGDTVYIKGTVTTVSNYGGEKLYYNVDVGSKFGSSISVHDDQMFLDDSEKQD